jgi:hypothetical protein
MISQSVIARFTQYHHRATIFRYVALNLKGWLTQMLEALERMIKYIEAGAGATAEIEYGAVLNQARAAIAAAKGE